MKIASGDQQHHQADTCTDPWGTMAGLHLSKESENIVRIMHKDIRHLALIRSLSADYLQSHQPVDISQY